MVEHDALRKAYLNDGGADFENTILSQEDNANPRIMGWMSPRCI